MAIVKEIKTGTATVKIDDSCFSGLSREALAERWAEVRRAILQIDREGEARNGRAGKGDQRVE